MGANKTHQQKGDSARLLDESDEFEATIRPKYQGRATRIKSWSRYSCELTDKIAAPAHARDSALGHGGGVAITLDDYGRRCRAARAVPAFQPTRAILWFARCQGSGRPDSMGQAVPADPINRLGFARNCKDSGLCASFDRNFEWKPGQMNSRIRLDRYVYEDIYPAFKAATDEKEICADMVHAFLNDLARHQLLLKGDAPAVVADIGSGPCDTLVKYLTGVSCPPGFIVRATDYLDKYANEERGEALHTLAAAQARNIIKLKSFGARAGDAFGGNILGLLSGHQGGPELRHAFRIVFVSHLIYHANSPSSVQRLLAEIANDLLNRDGICILFHGANTPGTFQDLRARFGSEAGATRQRHRSCDDR